MEPIKPVLVELDGRIVEGYRVPLDQLANWRQANHLRQVGAQPGQDGWPVLIYEVEHETAQSH